MSQQGTSSTSAAPGQQRLTAALDDFHSELTPAEQATLNGTAQPDVATVTEFSAKLNDNSNLRRKRLGDKVQPFLLFIQSLSDVIGIYIQSEPKIAALVWGSVKLLVQLASNYFDYFVKISDMFKKLEHLLPTLREFSDLFKTSNKLQDEILSIYAIIVEFSTQAFLFLKQPGLKQFAKSVWKPFKAQFEDIEGQLEEQRQRIDDEILIASQKAARDAAQSALIYQQHGYSHRRYEVDQWAQNRDWQIQQDVLGKKKKVDIILNKISTFDHTRCFINARDKKHHSSGRWLFTMPAFVDWVASNDSAILWYYGIPGSGKSVLATSVIEHLHEKSKSTKAALIYFFCDFQTADSLIYRCILSSLLRQAVLLCVPLDDTLQGPLEDAYPEKGFPPDIRQLETLFNLFINKLLPLYIVVDGIDECDLNNKTSLLALFKRLECRNPRELKIVISSRQEIDIQRALDTSYEILIGQATNRQDLQEYINEEVDLQCPNLELYSPDVKAEVKTALSDSADGLFLWVSFQLEDIRTARNKLEIEKVLRHLPKGLQETYKRILDRIHKERDEIEADRVFQWLLGYRRPLKLLELQDAISIRLNDTHHSQIRDRYHEDPHGIIQNCCNLLVYNVIDQTVEFSHSTVKQYLELQRDQKESNLSSDHPDNDFQANIDIALLCATYLELGDFATQIARVPAKLDLFVRPPRDWSAMLLPGKLKFMVPFTQYFVDLVSGGRIEENHDDGFKTGKVVVSAIKSKISAPDSSIASEFQFLPYALEFWAHHFDYILGTLREPKISVLESLIFDLNIPFPYLPSLGSDEPDAFEMFSWACQNDNVNFSNALGLSASPMPESWPGPPISIDKFRGDRKPWPTAALKKLNGINLLSLASQNGSIRIMEMLLDRLFDSRRVGSIAKMTPISRNKRRTTSVVRTVREILFRSARKRKFNPEPTEYFVALNALGQSADPLEIAITLGYLDISKMLLEEYIRWAIWGEEYYQTWYMDTMDKCIENGQLELIKFLWPRPWVRMSRVADVRHRGNIVTSRVGVVREEGFEVDGSKFMAKALYLKNFDIIYYLSHFE